VLYSDYIGPARLRLNLPELAPELKRVWHRWFRASACLAYDKTVINQRRVEKSDFEDQSEENLV